MEHQDNYYKGLFYGAVLGAAAGTIMGLLFAPNKGRETQQIITGKVRHALGRATDKASEFYDRENGEQSFTNEALNRSNEIIDNAKEEAKKILQDANAILRDIKNAKDTTRTENAS
ncbi:MULTISPECIES: YtxH domain-containing protein [Prosthecochloris]|uniref:YtxH domain-containing protein n=1 Tax=Prosthecochloris vibrioformis TaxID=1098 RepID=A0A5C4S315_PROVB|nr:MULTISPECIES: YtxH domain-containing protein [Prosthecochloris]ANT65746.1 Gas vesicle protein [Prosthecochloris sp. CIB 2401]TNJ37880.1 YtxH domain-containing protein [Prosthecochloris vibrioformis]